LLPQCVQTARIPSSFAFTGAAKPLSIAILGGDLWSAGAWMDFI
jgi:hypothetical protein